VVREEELLFGLEMLHYQLLLLIRDSGWVCLTDILQALTYVIECQRILLQFKINQSDIIQSQMVNIIQVFRCVDFHLHQVMR
jgi:hypothetical protein